MRVLRVFALMVAAMGSMVYALTAAELSKQVSSNNIIKITDKNYDKILNDREDYSVLVFITASSARVGCTLCTEVVPVFNNIASSFAENWVAQGAEHEHQKLFFAVADFMDNKKFFEKIGLQSVPKLYFYSPTAKKSSNNIAHFSEYTFMTNELLSGIVGFALQESKLPQSLFQVREPKDYATIFTRLSFLFLAVVTIYKTYYKFDKVVRSTFIYAFVSLLAIFSLTAGFMFNQIRSTPYSREVKGVVHYFTPGHQQQFGAETQLVSIVYFGLFIAMWFLISRVNDLSNAKAKFVSVIVLNACVFVLYSAIINFYHIKNGGYPFYLTQV